MSPLDSSAILLRLQLFQVTYKVLCPEVVASFVTALFIFGQNYFKTPKCFQIYLLLFTSYNNKIWVICSPGLYFSNDEKDKFPFIEPITNFLDYVWLSSIELLFNNSCWFWHVSLLNVTIIIIATIINKQDQYELLSIYCCVISFYLGPLSCLPSLSLVCSNGERTDSILRANNTFLRLCAIKLAGKSAKTSLWGRRNLLFIYGSLIIFVADPSLIRVWCM